MTHQSMGELVHALERAGQLERQPDPADGRARTIRLTAKAQAHDIELRSPIEPALDAIHPNRN